MIYIQGDTISNCIGSLLFFKINYFETYIKNFTNNNNFTSNILKKFPKNKPLIFVTKIELLNQFYSKVIPLLNRKFILITHYSDKQAGFHNKILKHRLLIKWYGQNMGIISKKTEAIPIGLENMYWKRTNLEIIKNNSRNNKNKLLYLNFSLHTYSDRNKIMNIILDKGFKKNDKLSWNDYIKDLSEHKFCISPRGNGVDSHRTWECLYLGVIPIVKNSVHMSYFKDLPILFIDNYDNISIEYLNKVYDEFQNKKFNLEKLDIKYWESKIKKECKFK
tara:strand:- start:401 stop:1231 length:831 start_codon:yes stop_codon:yes gene_type:complete